MCKLGSMERKHGVAAKARNKELIGRVANANELPICPLVWDILNYHSFLQFALIEQNKCPVKCKEHAGATSRVQLPKIRLIRARMERWRIENLSSTDLSSVGEFYS
jgi:hypothetical protein